MIQRSSLVKLEQKPEETPILPRGLHPKKEPVHPPKKRQVCGQFKTIFPSKSCWQRFTFKKAKNPVIFLVQLPKQFQCDKCWIKDLWNSINIFRFVVQKLNAKPKSLCNEAYRFEISSRIKFIFQAKRNKNFKHIPSLKWPITRIFQMFQCKHNIS